MSDCIICCDKYNKSNRKRVKCSHCDEVCCRACHQTYLLSKDIIDCMFCNKPQTFEHLKNSHYNTFINSTGIWKGKGYREHQEEVYFKNEMSMFPETLFQIEKDKKLIKLSDKIREFSKKKGIIEKKIKDIKKEKNKLCTCRNGIYNCTCIYAEESNILIRNYDELYSKKMIINHKINEIWIEINYINSSLFEGSIKKKKFIQKCMSDNCDGYLDSQWKCTKCSKTTCKNCREIKEKNHKCNKETIKTIQFAESSSKPCPKCNERIHRIYGCDQMYCPLCKVVFSYSSGEVQIGGVIHQPDAVKELRKNGKLHRDLRDIPCGGVNHIFLSKNKKKYPFLRFISLKKILISLLSWCVEYEDIQLRGVNQLVTINNLNSLERRMYLTGIITKEKFKKKIYTYYKSYEKEVEDRKIFAGFYICLSDMLRSLENMKEFDIIHQHINDILKLISNYNIELEKVHKIFKVNNNPYNFTFLNFKNNNNGINDFLRFGLINKNSPIDIDQKIDLEINKLLKVI